MLHNTLNVLKREPLYAVFFRLTGPTGCTRFLQGHCGGGRGRGGARPSGLRRASEVANVSSDSELALRAPQCQAQRAARDAATARGMGSRGKASSIQESRLSLADSPSTIGKSKRKQFRRSLGLPLYLPFGYRASTPSSHNHPSPEPNAQFEGSSIHCLKTSGRRAGAGIAPRPDGPVSPPCKRP